MISFLLVETVSLASSFSFLVFSSQNVSGREVLVGPEELLAKLIMGRIEAQNPTLGKERSNAQ